MELMHTSLNELINCMPRPFDPVDGTLGVTSTKRQDDIN
jgi:hypothetical protein